MGFIQALTDTYDYKWIAVNNMQHFSSWKKLMQDQYIWGMTDHEFLPPENKMNKKTK